MDCFCRLKLHLLVVSPIMAMGLSWVAGEEPTYYASQGHYWPQPYQSISENRTLTGISGVFGTQDMERITTTGGFLNPFQPLVNRSTATIPGGHDKVLNTFFGGFRVPTTENGHTMLWVGTTNNVGSPVSTMAVVWRADDTFITYPPIMGSSQLIPRDMNAVLQIAGNIVKDVDRLNGSDLLNIPVFAKRGGGVSVIEPSRVARAGYGYETRPREGGGKDQVIKDNHAVAMAINNGGAVVCDMHGSIYVEGFDLPRAENWSFVSRNGSVIVEHLPGGATDINDHGDVVGYNQSIGTWLSPGGGDAVVIDDFIPDRAYSTYQPRINNDRTVTWTGGFTTRTGFDPLPVRVWREGQTYAVAPLINTDETFEVEDVVDMNEQGDLLVRVRGEITLGDNTFEAPYFRILSQKPFAQELIVNVTGDEADADPNDEIIDTDLGKLGAQITLRAALDAVNARKGSGVKFDIPGGGVPRIILTKALPEVTEPIVINGTSQPGGNLVEVRGNSDIAVGLHLSGGESEVSGMVLTGFDGDGAVALKLSGPGKNRIVGNHIGVDATGNAKADCFHAIEISDCPENQIGGTDPDDSNIIYAESVGVFIKGAASDDNRVEGNRIGMAADGSILGGADGVALQGGNRAVVGSDGPGGNLIATASGVAIIPNVDVTGVTIQGNRIGLDRDGINSAPLGVGIALSGSLDGSLTNAQVLDNRIAGRSIGIWVLETKGTEISRNRIGLRFDGVVDVPTGLQIPQSHQAGVRLDRAEGVKITNNTIAGHQWDVLVSGSLQVFRSDGKDPDDPSDDFTFTGTPDFYTPPDEEDEVAGLSSISSNTIGIANGEKPPGFTSRSGIVVFGEAPDITIANNTIAGHAENEILLVDGTGHEVRGNLIGTDSQGTDYESALGVRVLNTENVTIGTETSGNTIGHHQLIGVVVDGKAMGTKIAGNEIGVAGAANNIPNPIGIRIARNEEDDDMQPDQTTIEGNTIGRGEHGIELENGGLVRVINNRIGTRVGGAPAPNAIGVLIDETIAILKGNTIGHNRDTGIQIDGDTSEHSVSIEGGSIFENGSDPDRDGIYYETPLFSPPEQIRALRSAPTNGVPGTAVFAVPAASIEGEVIYEFFGNAEGDNPQGEVALLRRSANGMQPFSANLSFTRDSAIASLATFRVTMTVGMHTTEFSTGTMSEVFEWPAIDTTPVGESDQLTIRWRAEDYFALASNDGVSDDWTKVDLTPTRVGDVNEVTVATNGDTELFRLQLDTERLLAE